MNQNPKVFFWSLSAALGGLLFGFDTAVISVVEQTLQKLWNLNSVEQGIMVSIALIATAVGSVIGGIPAKKLGRKKSLFIIALFYLVSSIGTAYAVDWSVFLVFRFMGGLGVSSVVAPLYISEIAPAHKRGRLVAMFQFNIVFGILMAYLHFFRDSKIYSWKRRVPAHSSSRNNLYQRFVQIKPWILNCHNKSID
jgi:SP family arabinose:H+ symporter-like MFS transporter